MTVRVRFAPSPTGHLHVGNVRTALFNWLFARQKQGSFILRIEDTDLARSEKRYESILMEDLKWLGLLWDEGVDVGGSYGPYRQTDRFDLYRRFSEQLIHERKAYYCFCSQEELDRERDHQRQAGLQPHYSGKCRSISPEQALSRLTAGEEATIRLHVREGSVTFRDLVFGDIEVETSTIGDFILVRSNGSPQYNFACVVDDASMKITHVIRGEGHISNTPRQILIYESLDFDVPQFAHLSTILGPDGSKLSKRHGAASVEDLREQGFLPEAVVNYLSMLGWMPDEEKGEILEIEEMIQEFDLGRVNRHPATFDPEKFKWVNRSHLKQLDRDRLLRLGLPHLKDQGLLPPDPDSEVESWALELLECLVNYIDTLQEIGEAASKILKFNPEGDLLAPGVRAALEGEDPVAVIQSLDCILAKSERPLQDSEHYRTVVREVMSETQVKGKKLFQPIRIAITARTSGPELDRLVPILEKGSQLPLPISIMDVRSRVAAVTKQLETRLPT